MIDDIYWFLVTEDVANIASLLCIMMFAFTVIYHIKYTFYSRKFRKITKSDYSELFETCRVGNKYSLESDSFTYMRYRSKKVYKKTNDKAYIELGEKLHKIGVIHKGIFVTFSLMFVLFIYFFGETIHNMN